MELKLPDYRILPVSLFENRGIAAKCGEDKDEIMGWFRHYDVRLSTADFSVMIQQPGSSPGR
jgi:hypothetical protein